MGLRTIYEFGETIASKLGMVEMIARGRDCRLLLGFFASNVLLVLRPLGLRHLVASKVLYTWVGRVRLRNGTELRCDLAYLPTLFGICYGSVTESVEGFHPMHGWVVVDVGAHIGIYSVKAGQLVSLESDCS